MLLYIKYHEVEPPPQPNRRLPVGLAGEKTGGWSLPGLASEEVAEPALSPALSLPPTSGAVSGGRRERGSSNTEWLAALNGQSWRGVEVDRSPSCLAVLPSYFGCSTGVSWAGLGWACKARRHCSTMHPPPPLSCSHSKQLAAVMASPSPADSPARWENLTLEGSHVP